MWLIRGITNQYARQLINHFLKLGIMWYIKINSRWFKMLNVKPKKYSIKEKRNKLFLCAIRIGNGGNGINVKRNGITVGKINHLDYILHPNNIP